MPDDHTTRVIDLGDRSVAGAAGHQPKPAVDRRRWERLRRRLVPLLAAALAVALLAALTGAPGRPAIDRQFQVTANDFFVDDTYLYTIQRQPAPADELAQVTAYRLSDGTTAWRTRLREPADELHVWSSADVSFLVSLAPEDHGRNPAGRVTMLDWQTGELLWTASGWPIGAAGDTVVVDPHLVVPSEEEHVYVGVDVATGAHRWRLGPLDAPLAVAAGHLIGFTGGELVSFHPETGQLVSATPAPDPADRPERLPVSVAGSLALLLDDGEPPVMHAFDLAGLAPRWSVEWDDEWGIPTSWPCEPVICVSTPGGGIGGLDPATGGLLWRATDPTGSPILGSGHPDDGVMLISDGARHPEQQVVATETGETLLELSGWRVLKPRAAPGLPTTAPTLGRLAVREFDDQGWLGWIADDHSGVEPVAPLPHLTGRCTHALTKLVCAESGSRVTEVTVWRLWL